jgi:hypothetical protein
MTRGLEGNGNKRLAYSGSRPEGIGGCTGRQVDEELQCLRKIRWKKRGRTRTKTRICKVLYSKMMLNYSTKE